MALSDQLAKLSVRAKEAETRTAAARSKAKADLEQDVSGARVTAQAEAEKLRDAADASRGRISDGWADVQRAWSDHVAVIHDKIDDMKAGPRTRPG